MTKSKTLLLKGDGLQLAHTEIFIAVTILKTAERAPEEAARILKIISNAIRSFVFNQLRKVSFKSLLK